MEENYFELTNPQKSIWLTNQMYPNTPIGNICGTVLIEETVDFNTLAKAIHHFVQKNDSFRLKFKLTEKGVMQYISSFEPFDIEIRNVKTDTDVTNLEKELVSIPFSVVDSLLFHFCMFQFPDGHGGFTINAHHLISDAWTAGLVVNEIVDFYAHFMGKLETLSDDFPSYAEYIQSEKEYLQSDRFQKDATYWLDSYQDVPEVASIPSNQIDYEKPLFEAKRKQITIDKSMIDRINVFCHEYRISIFNFFMGIFAIYLGRTANLKEFVIGTPILNRGTFKEKITTGMYISTVPFKITLKEDDAFSSFLQGIASDTLSMLRHQRYPYNILLETLRKTDANIPNLYDVLISYQNVRSNKQTSVIPYLARWIFNDTTSDGLDISLYDMNDTGSLDIAYDYCLAKYTEQDIVHVHERILCLIEQALSNPQNSLANFEIVTPAEKKEILFSMNNTSAAYPSNITIVDLFHEQVGKTPNEIALIYKQQKISYKALENMASVVAEQLKAKNIYHQKVAVISGKNPSLIASLLGIMQAGNCYVPIDPNYPKDRIQYILEDCGAHYVILEKQYQSLCQNVETIFLEDFDFLHYYPFLSSAHEDDLAYLIYTSGTTGKPKGVKILHKNIVNTLLWRKNYYPFDESIVTLQVPSYSFDSSVEDIYTSLISGSTLVLPSSTKLDINVVAEEIEQHHVNHFLVVPSLYKVMLAEKAEWLKNFKFITIAGEGFGIQLVKEHFKKLPNVRLINEYGPTENSVCSTYYELTEKDEKIYIGKPISNCHCYILDDNLHFLPIGTSGQLYVSGKGVSQGYLNKPDITKTHFIPSPFSDEILYKTGDIVKIDENQLLEFVGRNDGQVKLNGFRIELKEIDNILTKQPGVKDSVTILKDMPNTRKILVSYLLINRNFSEESLKATLKANLPYYMVPDIQILEAFPLTPNGKIDKSALPIPEQYATFQHVAPTSALEKDILEVCQEVLHSDSLGITDDLFKMGMADSLSILSISSQLFAKNIKIDTQDFYKYTTVKELAKHLENKQVIQKTALDIVKPKYKLSEKDFTQVQVIFPYQNVLLTGVTGFLGIHLLSSLLTSTTCHIYCLIRKKNNQNAHKRLEDTIVHYFGKDFLIHYASRISVLEGDLSQEQLGLSQEDYTHLQETVDCIIHSAAITKHYGNESVFLKENITTTQNLVELAHSNHSLLNYISTTTVSGNYLVKSSVHTKYTENDFFVGQNYEDNPYVKSKFEAEKMIFEEQYSGLNANIFRLGNLMARQSDGMFQKNKFENAFYLRLLAFATLGMIPKSLETQMLEFSPIDDTAQAIVHLLFFASENKTFHLFNPNLLAMSDMLAVFDELDLSCQIVDDNVFLETLKKKPNVLKYFVSDMEFFENRKDNADIEVTNQITEKILKKANFKWTKISQDYLKQFLKATKFVEDVKMWRNQI